MDLRSALLCVGGSVCSFKLVHTLLGGLQAPPREGHRAWRQRNIGTSLAHSSLSGAWAALWCVGTSVCELDMRLSVSVRLNV